MREFTLYYREISKFSSNYLSLGEIFFISGEITLSLLIIA